MTKITCITTTYNDENALYTSVNSILQQGYENFQYIIVDDGSSEETREIVTSLKDERIQVIIQANDGLSGARNKGLEHVTGDYVCFLDSDDSRPNWAFQSIADVIERDNPDLILCRGVLSELRGELLPFYDSPIFDNIFNLLGAEPADRGDSSSDEALQLAQLIEPQSANKVVRADLLKRYRIGFPNTHFFEDMYFHTNVLARSQRVSFLHSPTFTYFRRYLRPQITSANNDLRFDAISVAKLTLETFEKLPQFHQPYYRAAVVISCFKIVKWCESMVSHHYRKHYQEAVRAMLAMINPRYLHFPSNMPQGMELAEEIKAYVRALSND